MTAKPDRKPSEHIVFLDLETTGLDPRSDLILEIAVVVIDSQLDAVKTWSSVIQVEEAALVVSLAGNDFVRAMHTRNGLLAEIADWNGRFLDYVEEFIVEMLMPFLPVREDGSFDSAPAPRWRGHDVPRCDASREVAARGSRVSVGSGHKMTRAPGFPGALVGTVSVSLPSL